MSAAITRDLSVVYGGFTVGGSSDYHLDGLFQLSEEYDRYRFEADVTIISAAGTTEAQFATACASLEAAYRKPHQAFSITNNGQSWYGADPSTNTGFLARASIEKRGDTDGPDSGRSRKYRIRVEGQLPADLSGYNGRRSANIDISYNTENRRVVTISGVYTALSSNGAKAQYEASYSAFVSAVLSTWGGTYNLSDRRVSVDDQDKVLNFTHVYTEILLDESVSALNHASITRQVMAVTISENGPGDSPLSLPLIAELGAPFVSSGSAIRPQRLDVAVTVSVDAQVTTDLEALWQSVVKPWMIAHAQAIAGAGFAAIEEVTRTPAGSENVITGRLRGLTVAGSVLSHLLTVELTDNTGVKHLGVFGDNPLWKYRIQDERTVLRVVRQAIRVVKGSSGAGAGVSAIGGFGSPPASGGTGGLGAWVPVGQARRGIGSSITGSPGAGASAQQPGQGGGALPQAGAQGVPDAVPFNAGNLQAAGLQAPSTGGGEAFWDRLTTQQGVQPDDRGVPGYQLQTEILTLVAIDALRVEPPSGGA